MSDSNSNKTSGEDNQGSTDIVTKSSTDLVVVPVNGERSDIVDFTIVYTDPKTDKKTLYGVEKQCLCIWSKFFADLFEQSPYQEGDNDSEKDNDSKGTIVRSVIKREKEVEILGTNKAVVLCLLRLMHGTVPTTIWPIDHCSDLLEAGVRFEIDLVIVTALRQFYTSIIEETHCLDKTLPIKSRYGRGIAIKFISVWMRGKNKDFIFPPDVAQMYLWASEEILTSCYIRCGLDIKTANALQFIDCDSHKYFTSEDICFFLLYMEKFVESFQKGQTSIDIPQVQVMLKEDKEKRSIK